MVLEIKGKTLRDMYTMLVSGLDAGVKVIVVSTDEGEVLLRSEKISAIVFKDGEFPSMHVYTDAVVLHFNVIEKHEDGEVIFLEKEVKEK